MGNDTSTGTATLNTGMRPVLPWKPLLLPAVIFLAVCAAYANHFQNSFHFDDSHTIVQNPYVRSLHNLPRFFTDATTFSVLPANRTYRPVVSASLALDYALARGYNPFWFHFSSFVVFLLQLAAMYLLFRTILDRAALQATSQQASRSASLLAVAWYGLHPVMSETLNYVIQRGDIYSTFGVVAGMAIYACKPHWRKWGLYLPPLVFGLLSKPPAAVFPLLLFLYILLFEQDGKRRYGRALLAVLPSVAVCAAFMTLQSAMTPKTFVPSTVSESSYLITQPWVLLRYFGSFFLPIHLNVDTDLEPFARVNAQAIAGFVFVACLLLAAWFTARQRTLRPIAYGLLWFLAASLPTSLYRLSEVENDHRMYMPFVGLVLAVVWTARLTVERLATGRRRIAVLRSASAAAIVLLSLYGYGVHLRNRVWRTEESLWLDDVQKSPKNGRGLMNYGLVLLGKGENLAALDSFERALRYTPNYPTLELNLGIVNGVLNRGAEAEAHFQRALVLAPADDQARYFYGRWLYQNGRIADAVNQLTQAVHLNPGRIESRDLLAAADISAGDLAGAFANARAALQLAPDDHAAQVILGRSTAYTADDWINASLFQYQNKNYAGCIADAQEALKLKPGSELAYNNMGAAYAGLGQWNLAMANEREALRIKPDFTIAKNNLALYAAEKQRALAGPSASQTAEAWLNASLRDYQDGAFQKSIADAQHALELRPNYAEAYNNIAAAYASTRQWDEAIRAAQSALRLKPEFQLAKNNLAWAQAEKARQSGGP